MDLVIVPWAGLALLWALMAAKVKDDVSKEALPRRMIVLFACAAGFYLLLAAPHPPAEPITLTVGLALALIGCGFAAWSRLSLASNWSGRVTLKAGHELITTGPYRFVRHPIYSGLIVTAVGTALARHTLVAIAGGALLAAVWIYKIVGEEQMLQLQFGEQYTLYSRRVKRLIPGLL